MALGSSQDIMIIYQRFEWDIREAARNLAKHGVSFKEASTIFSDTACSVAPEGGSRFVATGRSDRGRPLVVAHEEVGPRIRIVSAEVQTAGSSRTNFRSDASTSKSADNKPKVEELLIKPQTPPVNAAEPLLEAQLPLNLGVAQPVRPPPVLARVVKRTAKTATPIPVVIASPTPPKAEVAPPAAATPKPRATQPPASHHAAPRAANPAPVRPPAPPPLPAPRIVAPPAVSAVVAQAAPEPAKPPSRTIKAAPPPAEKAPAPPKSDRTAKPAAADAAPKPATADTAPKPAAKDGAASVKPANGKPKPKAKARAGSWREAALLFAERLARESEADSRGPSN